MSIGGRELVATDEPAVMTKPLLDSIVVENRQCDRGLPNPTSADESNWAKVFSEMDYLLYQLIAPKEGPWWRRRGFAGYAGVVCKIKSPSGVKLLTWLVSTE